MIVYQNTQNSVDSAHSFPIIELVNKAGTNMIFTLTLNPSIDYYLTVDQPLMDTEVNRATHEQLKAGGKGLNVSYALHKLAIPSTAIAVLGGFSGEFIKEQVSKQQYVNLIPITAPAANRINVKIYQEDKNLNINAKGIQASTEILAEIFKQLQQVQSGDYVLVCGSLLKNTPETFLQEIADLTHQKQAHLVLDLETLSLTKLCHLKPFMIKPNLYEFELLLQKQNLSLDEIPGCLDEVLATGVESVLLSLGEKGAVYATQSEKVRLLVSAIPAINKVGPGDAMIGGFIGKLSTGSDIVEALKWGGAAGAAVAATLEDSTRDDIQDLYPHMKVERL
jgi:1-phosphofructokinase